MDVTVDLRARGYTSGLSGAAALARVGREGSMFALQSSAANPMGTAAQHKQRVDAALALLQANGIEAGWSYTSRLSGMNNYELDNWMDEMKRRVALFGSSPLPIPGWSHGGMGTATRGAPVSQAEIARRMAANAARQDLLDSGQAWAAQFGGEAAPWVHGGMGTATRGPIPGAPFAPPPLPGMGGQPVIRVPTVGTGFQPGVDAGTSGGRWTPPPLPKLTPVVGTEEPWAPDLSTSLPGLPKTPSGTPILQHTQRY